MKDYDAIYAAFDSPLMQEMRQEAYGEDLGQHSWVTADELRSDIDRLSLTGSSRLLDLGCGPCGPLVFAVHSTGCTATGLDASEAALISASARVRSAGVQERVTLVGTDLNQSLPFDNQSFDAVISLDALLHIRDRHALLEEVARVLAPRGKFLFTDAGVMLGPISNEEIDARSAHGYTQFVPQGFNEEVLQATGFTLIDREDRTAIAEQNARGRLRAMRDRQSAVEELVGNDAFARQQHYLETMIDLSARRTLVRVMYFAELATR